MFVGACLAAQVASQPQWRKGRHRIGYEKWTPRTGQIFFDLEWILCVFPKQTEDNIDEKERLRHFHIIGTSGVGKTTLIQNAVIQDIRRGRGVTVIDPHGDMVESLLDHIPRNRVGETIYWDAADTDYPIGFNILSHGGDRDVVSDEVVQVLKSIWADSWGPNMEFYLRNGIKTLMDRGGSSLVSLMRLFEDLSWRKQVLARIRDPELHNFWKTFQSTPFQKRENSVSALRNKVGTLTGDRRLRVILGQKKSSFDPTTVMNQGRVVLINLNRSALGRTASDLLGSLVVSAYGLSALGRRGEKDHSLAIDEFQNFSTDSFGFMVSECRKGGLGLMVSHQQMSQLTPDIQAVVRGMGGRIVFRVESEDAEVISRMNEELIAPILASQTPYKVVAMTEEGFSRGRSLRAIEVAREANRASQVIRNTRACITRKTWTGSKPAKVAYGLSEKRGDERT